MNYVIDVPKSIQVSIAAWNLPFETEDELYTRLDKGLTQDALDRLWRLPGPGFVFVYRIELQDPALLGVSHDVTFWLVHGAQDGRLAVQDCDYKRNEDWSSNEDAGDEGASPVD